jgi:hypothetical protein
MKKYKTKQNYYDTSLDMWKSLSNIKKPTYEYKGKLNQTAFPKFIEICKMSQDKLKTYLPNKLVLAGYNDVVIGDGYVYAKGDIPILLTAHMDTVHKETVKNFYEFVNDKGEHIISSPQGIGGDDRCGIYMILEIIKDYKPSILFCEDEEIGGIGSKKFCKTELIKELENMKYLIELDRANAKDAVFYDCDNPEFTEFITKTTGFKEAYGSFSDISNLAPECGVAAVNLSCGYYNAHTLREEVNVEEMLNTIKVVKKLLTTECEKFEYIEAYYGGYYGNYGYYGNSYYSSYKNYYEVEEDVMLYVNYLNANGVLCDAESYGLDRNEAWFEFFKEHPDICFNQVLDYDYL